MATDWVMVKHSKNGSVRIECERCGGGGRVKLPGGSEALEKLLSIVRKAHSTCPEKPKAN